MSYGMEFINDGGTRVVGKEEDNLKFIGKITSYTTSTYAYMTYLTFTVTSTEFPIIYLYMPYDDVGTCSNESYTEMTDCMIGGGAWSWTHTDEINMGAVHNIYNTTGDTWEVTVIGAHGGYPKDACLYVFNESGSTPSSDTWGFRTYKADGTTLAYDSGFKPLMAKWGAEFTAMPGNTFATLEKTFISGDWDSRSVDKPAFNCSINNIRYVKWRYYFCFDGDMTWYMLYYRHYMAVTSNGVAIWSTTPSGRYYPSMDYTTTNNSCDGSTSPFKATPNSWYYRTKTLPFIDGAKYD